MTFKLMLKFIIDNDITEKEYVLLSTMYYRLFDEELPKLIKQYAEKYGEEINGKKTMFGIDIKKRLVEKGMLYKDGINYQLTDKFLDLFVVEIIAGNELIDIYPSFITVNNVRIPLKTESRIELRKLYWQEIGGVRTEHTEVIKDVKYGVNHELLNMNIRKFIESNFWRDIRKLRLKEQQDLIKHDRDF